MIRRLRKLNQAGDTIVEVLIVLAVLGLALSIAYATANRGLQQSRNAQEHSQALGIINSQVELLRSAFAKQNGAAIETQGAAGPFCLSTSGANVTITPLANSGPSSFNENLASDKLNNTTTYPGPCIQNTLYDISVIGRGNGVYDFRVRWEGLGNLGRQQEEITYKIGNVTAAATGGYTDPEIPPPPAAPSLALSLTSTAVTVSPGGTFRLDWATTPAATSCTASGAWSGSKGASGSANITVPIGTTDTSLAYSLTCTLGTASTSQTINITVGPYLPNLAKLYRLYYGTNGYYNHLYSTSSTEGTPTYTLQGNVGSVDTNQGPGEVPLYRFYSPSIGDHFYTANAQEYTNLVNDPAHFYGYEGIVGYIKPYSGGACPAGTHPLYRMYSSYLTEHFYTDNVNEYNQGTDLKWSNNDPGPGSIFTGHPFTVPLPSPPFPPSVPAPWYNYPEGIAGCVFNNQGT